MPFSEEQKALLAAAINPKLVYPCASCGNKDWLLIDGVAVTILPDNPTSQFGVTRSLPSVAVVCKVCGNTLFFNVFFLGPGIAQALGVKPPGETNG